MPTPFRLANIKSSEGSWNDGNESADLWKMGDGIACLELKTKANTLDDKVLDMIKNAIERGKKGEFKGLVIGGDGDKFSSGAFHSKIECRSLSPVRLVFVANATSEFFQPRCGVVRRAIVNN